MAGYQILGIRSFFDERTRKQKKYDAFFEKRWRFDNIAEIFTDPIAILDKNKVPLEERYNLYYTISYCGDAKRQSERLEIIPFDVDGIDLDRIEEYIAPILKAIQCPDATVVASGNGLHFIQMLADPIRGTKDHEERRFQYRAILNKIDANLEHLRLPGKADPAVWDLARILRIPGTLNIKPDKQDISKVIEKMASVLRLGTLTPMHFDWEKISGAKKLDATQAIPAAELRRYRQADGIAAMEECAFLAHIKAKPAEVDEPEMYAALSIMGRFKDGVTLATEVFKPRYGVRSNGGSPEAIVEKTHQAVAASGPRTCSNVNSIWGKCQTCPLYGKISSPVTILGKDVIPTEATGFYNILIKKDGAPQYVPNYPDLLRAFLRENPYKTIADMKTVFIFNGTHYVDITPIEVRAFAETNFNPPPKETIRQEFLHKVLANQVTRRKFFTNGIETKINFKNGVLDIVSRELTEHSPDYGFRAVQPYDYDPHAACPTFDWWIKDIMLGDEELIALLQEFMGYIVRGGDYKYHKALWLAGTGRNGKSTFIDIIKALIGHDNYATLSIKSIIGDKFSSASLDGKIANFSEETSPEELSDSGPFKNLTGDGDIEAQKKYGDPYRFRNKAKLIMSYNEVPILKDLSPGMLSRPIIIPFKRDLTEKGAQDKTLKDKLLAELPGIFNFALRGWERLEAQGDFTDSDKSRLEMEEVRDSSCSAAQWVKENIEFLPFETTQVVKARELYNQYKLDVGNYAYSETKFGRRLHSIPAIASRKRKTDKGNVYVALKVGVSSSSGSDF